MSNLARVLATTEGDQAHLAVSGEIDLSNATDIGDRLASAVPGGVSRVVVDLSHTDYMDSAGLAMLFRFAEKCGYQRQELRVVAPPEGKIRMILDLTRFADIVPVDDVVG